MLRPTKHMSNTQYMIQLSAAMTGYALVLIGSIWLIESREMTGWPAGLLSLAPLIPGFFALRAMVARISSMDEYKRKLAMEATIWAVGIVSFASFGYGFLEGSIGAPRLSMFVVMPSLVGLQGAIFVAMNVIDR